MKNALTTNLLGRRIKMNVYSGCTPQTSYAERQQRHSGCTGEIVSVFLDPDGTPMYTIAVAHRDGTELADYYTHAFTLAGGAA